MTTVITFGTFDLFHIGHLRILERAAALGDRLVVGVCTDEQSRARKGVAPAVNYQNRAEIVSAIKVVDEVFAEEYLDEKAMYITKYGADIFAIGDDWAGKFDHLSSVCQVVYFPRTPAISTTLLRVEICQTSTPLITSAQESGLTSFAASSESAAKVSHLSA